MRPPSLCELEISLQGVKLIMSLEDEYDSLDEVWAGIFTQIDFSFAWFCFFLFIFSTTDVVTSSRWRTSPSAAATPGTTGETPPDLCLAALRLPWSHPVVLLSSSLQLLWLHHQTSDAEQIRLSRVCIPGVHAACSRVCRVSSDHVAFVHGSLPSCTDGDQLPWRAPLPH